MLRASSWHTGHDTCRTHPDDVEVALWAWDPQGLVDWGSCSLVTPSDPSTSKRKRRLFLLQLIFALFLRLVGAEEVEWICGVCPVKFSLTCRWYLSPIIFQHSLALLASNYCQGAEMMRVEPTRRKTWILVLARTHLAGRAARALAQATDCSGHNHLWRSKCPSE